MLVLGWIVLGYLAFRSSVEEANARLEEIKPPVKPVLTPQNGLLLNRSTNILVLGVDARPGQVGGRSDTLQIIHTDPDKHLMSTLSIPRDLEVTIPGRRRPRPHQRGVHLRRPGARGEGRAAVHRACRSTT